MTNSLDHRLPLDHTQDVSGRETHRLTTLYSAPDFVKAADFKRTHGDDTLPRHAYADMRNKLYPCHTGPATWMSALFFADKEACFEEADAAGIKTRILDAAKYFGILGSVSETMGKVAAANDLDLEKLADDEFAIVWTTADKKERYWPMRNETEVKHAAFNFNEWRDEFVFEDRQKIAVRILEKAAAYGADIGESENELAQTAGYGACAAKTAAAMVRDRAGLVARTNKEAAEEMKTLAGLMDEHPEHTREHATLLKLAAAIDEFDRVNHLDRLYKTNDLDRPESVLFAVTEKVARDFMQQNVETTTGSVYALDDLEKLAVDDMRSWLGDDFVDAVTAGGVYVDREKMSAIIPTLDRGMAALLDRLMQENKMAAVAYTKQADSQLSLDRLYELAQQAD